MRKNEGITLVGLLVTIMVLLALSGILINVMFGENGTFERIQNSKIQKTQDNYKEKLNSIIMDEKIKIASKGIVLTRDIVKELILEQEETWISAVENNEEKQSVIITTVEGYIFYVVVDNGKAEIFDSL